jgi:hypothetical protein
MEIDLIFSMFHLPRDQDIEFFCLAALCVLTLIGLSLVCMLSVSHVTLLTMTWTSQ